jgi:hypothetical protein
LDALIGHIYSRFFSQDSSVWARILLIAVLAVVIHILVKCIRRASEWMIIRGHGHNGTLGVAAQKPKVITVTRLVVSSIILVLPDFVWVCGLKAVNGERWETFGITA